MSRLRRRAIIGLATLGVMTALAAVLAVPGTHARPASTRAITVPCEPANQMTPQQRAALAASLGASAGFRHCTPGSSTTIHLTAYDKFLSLHKAEFTDVYLQHVACDNRSVYADIYDSSGWTGYYFYTSLPCGNTAYFAGPDYVTDSYYVMKAIWVRLYDCNSTSCSNYTDSNHHANCYYNSKYSCSSSFSFCNNTGPNGSTIACFKGKLD